jgi:hypothetical protein
MPNIRVVVRGVLESFRHQGMWADPPVVKACDPVGYNWCLDRHDARDCEQREGKEKEECLAWRLTCARRYGTCGT